MRESCGELRFTTVLAAEYARLMSSCRANSGDCLPATWHEPQRFVAFRLSQRLTLNDCTSAVDGGGPLYDCGVPPLVTGFCSVLAPPPHAASSAANDAATSQRATRTPGITVTMAVS